MTQMFCSPNELQKTMLEIRVAVWWEGLWGSVHLENPFSAKNATDKVDLSENRAQRDKSAVLVVFRVDLFRERCCWGQWSTSTHILQLFPPPLFQIREKQGGGGITQTSWILKIFRLRRAEKTSFLSVSDKLTIWIFLVWSFCEKLTPKPPQAKKNWRSTIPKQNFASRKHVSEGFSMRQTSPNRQIFPAWRPAPVIPPPVSDPGKTRGE